MPHPKKYSLPQIGSSSLLTIAENVDIPFQIKRAFWITSIKKGEIKGEHAHKKSRQLLICISGELQIVLEDKDGNKYSYLLSKPNEAVYIPAQYWGKIVYKKDSVILALASDEYDEQDYIRDYNIFKSQ